MYENILIEKVNNYINDCETQIENISRRQYYGEINETEAKRLIKICEECKESFEAEIEYLKNYHEPVELFWPTSRTVDALRKTYPEGTRVRLLEFKDAFFPDIPVNTLGTVDHIDDSGTIFVRWDNNCMMGMVHLVDGIEKVYKTEVCLTIEEDACIFVEAPGNPDLDELKEAAMEKYSNGAYTTNSFEVKNVWHQGLEEVG